MVLKHRYIYAGPDKREVHLNFFTPQGGTEKSCRFHGVRH